MIKLQARRRGVFFLWTLGFMLTAAAQQPSTLAASLADRYRDAHTLYEAKHYTEAAAILEPYYAAGPTGIDDWNTVIYALACYEALAGRKEKAMDALAVSEARGGGVRAEHMATDADLVSLHDDPRFKQLVDAARKREHLWVNEPGKSLPYVPNLSEDAKIAGLSTVWSEVRFNFAFFERQPDLDWNQAYLDFLPKVRATTSTEDYYRVLIQFAALLKDGHTNVFAPDALDDTLYSRPALRTQLVENAVVVTRIEDPGLLAQRWRVGDVLLKIDGEDIKRYAELKIAPYQSSSTPQDLQVRTFDYGLLRGRAGSQFHVTVRNAEGKDEERVLTRLTLKERSKFVNGGAAAKNKASFTLRPDGIAVLTVDEFEDTEGTKVLLANLPAVNSSKGLIIDIRANGGGSTPWDFLQLLTQQPIRMPMSRTRSYFASDRAMGSLPGWRDSAPDEIPADSTHHVDVGIAVLTSARTFSAAEDFVASFNAMHRGITVGETTAGSTGQPLFFELPGGGSARVCTKNDRASDGTVFEGVGLRPTIPISPTIESIQRNSDIGLERAVEALLAAKPSHAG